MNIFSVFTLVGGLALFLYGMSVMSSGLEKMAGGKLERILTKMTSNRFKALALGAGITAAVQSSSAITVMVIGLVNSGIMQFGQSIGVIMGSNIGTTITAWLLSLVGLEGSNFFVKMLKPENFSPLVALFGVILFMMSKSGKKKDIGTVLIGFAVLMFGMSTMSGAVAPLKDMEGFKDILTMFTNPLIGVAVGAIITALIQSSSASVAILVAVSRTGNMTYRISVPIILGQNIGTCITALISSIGVNKNAKRVAAVHLFFNLIGTAIFLSVFYLANAFFKFAFLEDIITPFGIAVVHSAFNISTTLLLLPFTSLLEKLAMRVVKDKSVEEEYEFLDERLLKSPSFAIAECRKMTVKMAVLAKDTLYDAIAIMDKFDEKTAAAIRENENKVDVFEDKLGSFLVKLSSKSLNSADSREISKLLHCIGDFERISDHAVNILTLAEEVYTKKIEFSEDAKKEKRIMVAALTEIVDNTVMAFETNNLELAGRIEPLEQVIDGLRSEMKRRHIQRLQTNCCTIELGFIFTDFISNCERVSDHCSNIAVSVLQMKEDTYDTHTYLNEMKTNQPHFIEMFEEYKTKYLLP